MCSFLIKAASEVATLKAASEVATLLSTQFKGDRRTLLF